MAGTPWPETDAMDRALWDQLTILRKRTQAGLSDCRRALAEAEGDIEDAVLIITGGGFHTNLQRLLFRAQVHAAVSPDGRTAVLIECAAPNRPEVHAEVLNPFFAAVLAVAGRTPRGADLEAQPLGDTTVGAAAAALSAQIAMPIAVRRWTRVDVAPGAHGRCAAHVHHRREVGAIVAVEAPSAAVSAHPAMQQFTDDLARWVFHRRPIAHTRADLDATAVAEERAWIHEILSPLTAEGFTADEIDERKHRMFDAWIAKRVLLEQRWGWETDAPTIDAQRRAASLAADGEIRITRFAWFERGGREHIG
ncbi:MAG: hypothetical protein QM820_34140 [Minicystis sp.]